LKFAIAPIKKEPSLNGPELLLSARDLLLVRRPRTVESLRKSHDSLTWRVEGYLQEIRCVLDGYTCTMKRLKAIESRLEALGATILDTDSEEEDDDDEEEDA
jgi:hypothetical protein